MKTIFAAFAVSTLALSGAAFAGGHSNAPAATGMATTITEGEPGNARAASTLRPGGVNEPLTTGAGDRGWGNAGSRELAGDQVSDFGRTKRD